MIIAFGQTIDAIVTEAPEQVIKGRNRQAVNVTTSDLSYLQAKDLFSSDVSREAFFLANSDGNDYSDYVVFGGVTDNENGTVTVLMGKRLDGDVLPSDLLLNSAYEKMVMGLSIGEGQTILAGSPVNKDGIVANDDTAIGILLEDVAFPKKNGEVLISGFIDAIKAQTASGLTYSADMMASLKNIMFDGVKDYGSGGGGAASWKDLGMGFGTVFEAERIQLDYIQQINGSTGTGYISNNLIAGKPYNVTINGKTYSNVIAETITTNNGIEIALGDTGIVTNWAWTENGYPFIMSVPQSVGLLNIALRGKVTSCNIKIEGESIVPIPNEYLPSGVGGMIIDLNNITEEDIENGRTYMKQGRPVYVSATWLGTVPLLSIDGKLDKQGVSFSFVNQVWFNRTDVGSVSTYVVTKNDNNELTGDFAAPDTIFIKSPSGKKFFVTINDNGELTAEIVN